LRCSQYGLQNDYVEMNRNNNAVKIIKVVFLDDTVYTDSLCLPHFDCRITSVLSFQPKSIIGTKPVAWPTMKKNCLRSNNKHLLEYAMIPTSKIIPTLLFSVDYQAA